jgi:hypothetical protein
MAVRMYSRLEVERMLRGCDCHHVKDYETAALWSTSRGYHFTVPQSGDDRRTDENTMRSILQDIENR